jgi:hypothetical protein
VLFLANWLPLLLFLASLLLVLWRFFDPLQQGYRTDLSHFLLPLVVLIVVLVLMHVMISLLLPLRWASIRDEFRRQLEERLRQEMEAAYLAAPGEVEQALLREREQINRLAQETRDVEGWLEQREQASSITGLYGN